MMGFHTMAKAASLFAFLAFASLATSAQTVNDVRHTFYGCKFEMPPSEGTSLIALRADPDNSPPGAGIAYDCGRGYKAGGTGSYDDPHTMASAPGEFDKCEIIWDPYTRKYLRFEDTCGTCTTQWKDNRRHHIDIWLGPTNKNDHQKVINCEDALTPDQGQPVVRNPPKDHAADSKSSCAFDC
jgi:hypothetical protein